MLKNSVIQSLRNFANFLEAKNSMDNQKIAGLAPLTPEYIKVEHEGYVEAIISTLDNPKIRNIALSGNYGVGKSSILQKVAELKSDRVVELSLSTLAPIATENNLDESIPKQATTPTNRIQQEIVKQLLYREEPNRTPRSRFRRIERFSWLREFIFASLIGLAIAVAFILTGWTGRIVTEFKPFIDFGLWAHLIVLAFTVSITFTMRYLLQGRINIRQLSAGSATVTLDETVMSYFDQYLDEIVYFFEVSNRDIVIFEDIDRFNDSHIFETLRSLNSLLNVSPQLSKSKPIRFIYAIKDSIFDRIGLELEGRQFKNDPLSVEDPAQAEIIRANRTKFFDLVIPVVPFITHRSARNITTQLLKGMNHNISPELIDLAGKYVPDMRLLKNVCNEFIVFRNRIFSGDGKHLNLNETELFAMMLYKNTHLSDFETIKIGKSNLDKLYELGRKLVTINMLRIDHEMRQIRKRIENIDGISDRSKILGKRLIQHVDRTIRSAGFNKHSGQYVFDTVLTEDELQDRNFWIAFINKSKEINFLWRNNFHNQRLTFTQSDLELALNENFNIEDWNEAAHEQLSETLTEQYEHLKFLRSADMSDLFKRSEFLVKNNESDQSFEAVTKNLLKIGLAYNLIRAGYINRNFTLYTSTFHGDRVSPAATNFIIHHVDRDIMDEYFKLDDNDVEAVIRECEKKSFAEPALYNIDILDFLLKNNTEISDITINSLVRLADDQKRFLQAYLNSAKEKVKLIERFTRKSSQIFKYLVNQVELDFTIRSQLINTALINLVDDINYQTDSGVSAYLRAHYLELTSLTLIDINETSTKRIGKFFSISGVKVDSLLPLSKEMKHIFIAQDLYLINRENLQIALESKTSLALDIAFTNNKTVYIYILQNLSMYLAAINEASATIDSQEHFTAIVNDVLRSNKNLVGEVIKYSAKICRIDNLETLPENVWPHLARYQRFPATVSNLGKYINSVGSVDANLATILNTIEKIIDEASEETEKINVAKSILLATEHISSIIRAKLVGSLNLEEYLDLNEIKAEKGELFALLLKYKVISDSANTYSHLSETDWPTRELFVRESKKFIEYISPELIAKDVSSIFASDQINIDIKIEIASNASEYVYSINKAGLIQLAQFCIQQNIPAKPEVIEKFASEGVRSDDVIILLEPHLKTLPSETLFSILQVLNGDYEKLTMTGRDQPKIPNTTANCALLDMLKLHGIVSSYNVEGNVIRVNKRYQ